MLDFRAPLVVLAGALATALACLGVCPAETIRIRMVSQPDVYDKGLLAATSDIVATDGLWSLWDGLPPVLVRQILFGAMKFFVFDVANQILLDSIPLLREMGATGGLLTSLLAGLIAGVSAVMYILVRIPCVMSLAQLTSALPLSTNTRRCCCC